MTLNETTQDAENFVVKAQTLALEPRGKDPAVELYVESIFKAGNPSTPVFLLPGGPGADHQRYKKDYTELFKIRNFIFWDPRGCGKSGSFDFESYDMETYVDDVFSIVQKLGLKKVIILGISCGAMAAIRFTAKYPQITEKLILTVGAYNHRFIELAKKKVEEKGSPEQIEMAGHLLKGCKKMESIEHYLKVMLPLYSYRIAHGEKFSIPPSEFNIAVANHGFSTYLTTFDYTQECQKIDCPTAIFAGQHDWICDVSQSKEMAKLIPNSQLHVYEQASHLLTLDVKKLYFSDLIDFLSSS